jgi:hypothetical protein
VCIGEVGGLEAVGAHQLGQELGLVCRSAAHGAHLDQRHIVAALGELPGRLTARQPAANDQHFAHAAEPASSGVAFSGVNSPLQVGHFTKSPRALVLFATRNGAPQSGHGPGIGRSQLDQSHAG